MRIPAVRVRARPRRTSLCRVGLYEQVEKRASVHQRLYPDTLVEAVRNTQAPELNLSDLALGPNLQHFSLPDNAARRTAIHSLLRHVKYLAPTHRNEVVATIAAKAGVCPRGDLMMSSNQVKALRSAGMQIGAHTVTHPILRRQRLAGGPGVRAGRRRASASAGRKRPGARQDDSSCRCAARVNAAHLAAI